MQPSSLDDIQLEKSENNFRRRGGRRGGFNNGGKNRAFGKFNRSSPYQSGV